MKAYPSFPWLDAAIEILLGSPGGTAHVDEIVRRTRRWNVKDPKNTIVRTLNTYCSTAADFDPRRPDRFERVGPNTFRLRSYPGRPVTPFARKQKRQKEAEALLQAIGLLPRDPSERE